MHRKRTVRCKDDRGAPRNVFWGKDVFRSRKDYRKHPCKSSFLKMSYLITSTLGFHLSKAFIFTTTTRHVLQWERFFNSSNVFSLHSHMQGRGLGKVTIHHRGRKKKKKQVSWVLDTVRPMAFIWTGSSAGGKSVLVPCLVDRTYLRH